MISKIILSWAKLIIGSDWASLLRSRNSPLWILLMSQIILRFIMRRTWYTTIWIWQSLLAHSIRRVIQRESWFYLISSRSRCSFFWYGLWSCPTHSMERALITHQIVCWVILAWTWVIISGILSNFLVNGNLFWVFTEWRSCLIVPWSRYSNLIFIQDLTHPLRFCHWVLHWRFPCQIILRVVETRSRISL